MSILTNFPAIPSRIAIGCEYLQFCGEGGITKEAFATQMSPEPIKGGEGDEFAKTPMAELVLKEMLALGVADDIGGSVRLSTALPSKNLSLQQWMDWLRPWIRARINDVELAAQTGQGGVAQAIAWLLCQDPRQPMRTSTVHAERLIAQLGSTDALGVDMANNSRFQNLVYWARYLGYAEALGLKGSWTVLPDPTRAIREMLPEVFKDRTELSASAFVERLGALNPVMEFGSLREEIESRLPASCQRRDQHFSLSTSVALKRLKQAGDIDLHFESDAQRWVLDDGRAGIRVSRLTWPGGRQ